MRVIPAINVASGDEEALVAKLDVVRGAADLVHLDVCDGTFTENETWGDPYRWQELAGDFAVQVHLMVAEPAAALGAWLSAGAAEVVVHYESLGEDPLARLVELEAACAETGAALLLAGGVGVAAERLLTCKGSVEGFLVLGVTPGYAGQATDAKAEGMVRALREGSGLPIWVDGGMNETTIAAMREAGASGAVAASAVFDAGDPAAALAALQLQ